MRIAVIGSGISGLSAAHYLSKKNKVDLFEKEDHFGGHSHTIDIEDNKIELSFIERWVSNNDYRSATIRYLFILILIILNPIN